jgi:hypothetical protein
MQLADLEKLLRQGGSQLVDLVIQLLARFLVMGCLGLVLGLNLIRRLWTSAYSANTAQ